MLDRIRSQLASEGSMAAEEHNVVCRPIPSVEEAIRRRVRNQFSPVFEAIAECYADWEEDDRPIGLKKLLGDLRTYVELKCDREVHEYDSSKLSLRLVGDRRGKKAEQLELPAISESMPAPPPPEKEPKKRPHELISGERLMEFLRQMDASRARGISMPELSVELGWKAERFRAVKRLMPALELRGVVRSDGSHRSKRYYPGDRFQEAYELAQDGEFVWA
jgi:hypothetical protein